MTMDVENGAKIINMQRNDSFFSFAKKKTKSLYSRVDFDRHQIYWTFYLKCKNKN